LPLAPADRRILIAAAILMVALTLALVIVSPAAPAAPSAIPTTYSPAPGGAKAAWLLLRQSGYDVRRWQQPSVDLEGVPEARVLILADPSLRGTERDRRAVLDFVRAGGTVLATGALGAEMIGGEKRWGFTPATGEWRVHRPRIPGEITRGIRAMTLHGAARWEPDDPRWLVHFGEDRDPAVQSLRVGSGRMIWWASAAPLTNDGIPKEDNLTLFLNAIGPPGAAPILWDEYYHGVQSGLLRYVERTPLPWALAQALLILVAAVATWGRRLVPPRAASAPAPLSPLEFVETMGGLYHRAHAAGSAVEVAHARLRTLLTRRLGLVPAAAFDQIGRAARERLLPGGIDVGALLARGHEAVFIPRLRDAEALALVKEIHHCERTLRLAEGPAAGGARTM
jgi:hypothetical protein